MTTAMDRIPVIIGAGEFNDRPVTNETGLDAVELMAETAKAAERDAGGGWLDRCDWLAITPQISFRALDVPKLLPRALAIAPHTVFEAEVASGDTPLKLISDAANAIASSRASVCVLVGGEALRTSAYRRTVSGDRRPLFQKSHNTAPALRKRYGLVTPIEIYPLYENACRAAWGQTLAQGQEETGIIWSKFSEVAQNAEGAWMKRALTPQEIVEASPQNRPIAFPYTKLMVANASVNQGAAVIVTNLALARAAGIADDRIVYIGASAAAHENNDPLARADWTSLPAMRTVLREVLTRNSMTSEDLDVVELYSCFPCVPKMARRELELPVDMPLSVHGGLTFGGGPIGNYMMHAAAAMVRELRRGAERGLLFGNGGHCTHMHALVLARHPVPRVTFPLDYDVQHLADAGRAVVAPIADEYEGEAVIETYTAFYDRSGAPTFGVVLARAPGGDRVLAKVDAADAADFAFLTSGECEPVGTAGRTVRRGEALYWQRS